MKPINSGIAVLGLAVFAFVGALSAAENEDQPSRPVSSAGQPEAGSLASKAYAPGGLNTYTPLTGKERWDFYLRESYWSPAVFFRAAGPALGAHLGNEPPEWGQGMEGYSKRFANRFARFTIRGSIEAGGAALLQHEVRYVRSTRSGFFPRAGHALAANFVTYDKHGRRRPHVSRVGSAFAAEFIGNTWMPDGYRTTTDAMRGVGVEVAIGSAFNLIREFSPELKRLLPWKN